MITILVFILGVILFGVAYTVEILNELKHSNTLKEETNDLLRDQIKQIDINTSWLEEIELQNRNR